MQALEFYDISPATGFLLTLPTPPPKTLAPHFNLLERSHHLLKGHSIRRYILKLPTLDTSQLETYEEKLLAHKVLTFLASQYIWQDGVDSPAATLPAVIAVPLVQVSIDLGCQPVLSYTDLVLANCFAEKPHIAERQSILVEFTPTHETVWSDYFKVFGDVEVTSSEALRVIAFLIRAMEREDVKTTSQCLIKLAYIISIMGEKLNMNARKIDPKQFSLVVGPYCSGWRNIVYEDVSDEMLKEVRGEDPPGNIDKKPVYLGASGDLSPTIHTLDALLGVEYSQEITEFHEICLKYMVNGHREFIEDMRSLVHLRTFVRESKSDDLLQAYNFCAQEYIHFKLEHFGFIKRYVIDTMIDYAPNEESREIARRRAKDISLYYVHMIEKTDSLPMTL